MSEIQAQAAMFAVEGDDDKPCHSHAYWATYAKSKLLAAHWEGRVCLIILSLARNLLQGLMHMGAGVTLKAG